jgi:hypothetical protein
MGASDRFVPRRRHQLAQLKTMFARSPSRVCVLPDAGHVLLPSAAVSRAADEIAEFLR